MALPYEWQLRVNKIKVFFHRFFGGNEEAPRPKMCPACGTLVGVSATRCHECGTTVLLIVNFLMFAVTLVSSLQRGTSLGLMATMDGEVLYRLGASSPVAIFYDHQWFRLVTAMFLHFDILHIAFNMWVLWDIGPIIEEVYGSARYLFLYTITGIAGFLLSALRGHNAVGASTALMGLIGIMLAITTKRGGAAMKAERSRLILWIVIIFAWGMASGLNVDNWGHFGGVASGFALGRIFADRQPTPGNEMKRAYALGWLAAVIILVSFAFMIWHVRDGLS